MKRRVRVVREEEEEEGVARVKARLRMSRSCRDRLGKTDEGELWKGKDAREYLGTRMISTAGWKVAILYTPENRRREMGRQMGWSPGDGGTRKAVGKRNGIPWKVFRPAIRQLLDLTLFQIRPVQRPTGAFYPFRSPSIGMRRRFPLT